MGKPFDDLLETKETPATEPESVPTPAATEPADTDSTTETT